MKDKQVQTGGPVPGIPLISPLLHVVSMTGLVFLRTSFGYAFLRPKSILLACIWAHALFAFYAWHEPAVWPRWRGMVLYGTVASFLYLAHLLTAFGRELRRAGKHDYDSGTPHLMRLAGLFRPGLRERLEAFVQLWFEPAVVLLVSLILEAGGVAKLPAWLACLAVCLWTKEALNHWYRLRHHKKQTDVFDDAGEGLDPEPERPASVTGTGRKPRQRRPRAANGGTEPENAGEADRHAEILRLLPPYTLAQAEANYRLLLRSSPPEADGQTISKRAADLAGALEYFRRHCARD